MNLGESGLSPVPAHVPPELVYDFDFLMPPSAIDGARTDVQLAWKRLHDEAPDIFWTPRNGGHWIATRGEDIKEIQTNHQRYSQRVMTRRRPDPSHPACECRPARARVLSPYHHAGLHAQRRRRP